jgi:UDP-N-acetylmuramoyl-tripeptide--D-alanyl-D-alanine ligase
MNQQSDAKLRVARWSPGKIARAVDGELRGDARAHIGQVSTDTRTMEAGSLFVALRGERFDAHAFLADAVDGGATGVMVGESPTDATVRSAIDGGDVWCLRVEDTEEALISLAKAVWREADEGGMHTVDVTGSNGKTTTKELLESLWGSQGPTYATPGNYNNRIGVSLTLCGLPADTDHAIIEMGANAPDEIDELIRMAPGRERIITSIAPAHLEGFGSLDGVRRAKSEISHESGRETSMIVPVSEREHLYLGNFRGEVVTFGKSGEGADIEYTRRVENTDPDVAQEVTLRGLGREWRVPLGLPGAHNASNLAAAVATGWSREVDFEASAARALVDVELPSGRWRRREVGGVAFVDDAYNANPASMESSLRAFLESEVPQDAEQRVVLVVGEIAEMGVDAQAWHHRVGARLAEVCTSSEVAVDGACMVGEYREALAAGFQSEGSGTASLLAVDDIGAAADWLVERRPTTVWMKASRAAELERLIPMVERLTATDEET